MRLTLYESVSLKCSRVVTTGYSTSFSLGILMLGRQHRSAVYAIYGFVRLADEIVDTFFGQTQGEMLEGFRLETFKAIKDGISTNPVLNSFQWVVNRYKIDTELIGAFFSSMSMDLDRRHYDQAGYEEYIYGSAEAVGLMCLRVFCGDDEAQFRDLTDPARKLGSAFQKVNFLRDMRSDYLDRGRVYFPDTDFRDFTKEDKIRIEADIQTEFDRALTGIKMLDYGSRRGVYLAYLYYRALFAKIRKTTPQTILGRRFRISGFRKAVLLKKAVLFDMIGLIR